MANTRCVYKKHSPPVQGSYGYDDERNGINKTISICKECFAEHILKHYPLSQIAEHIRQNPDEYKNELPWSDASPTEPTTKGGEEQ